MRTTTIAALLCLGLAGAAVSPLALADDGTTPIAEVTAPAAPRFDLVTGSDLLAVAPAVEVGARDARLVYVAAASEPEGAPGAQPTSATAAQPAEPLAPAVEPSAGDAASALLFAARNGEWIVAVGFAIWLLVHLLRWKKLLGRISWVRTRAGGYALSFATALAVVIAGGLSAGAGWSIGLLFAGLAAGLTASGLNEAAKDVTNG